MYLPRREKLAVWAFIDYKMEADEKLRLEMKARQR